MAKKIDVITSGSINAVHGVNYVIKSFIEGRGYFENSDFVLNKLYTSYEVLSCSPNFSTSTPQKLSTVKTIRNSLRKMLKLTLNKKILAFALIRFYFNSILTARQTMCKYWKNPDGEYIIFHDAICCYLYHKRINAKGLKSVKTILVLHCGEDVFDSLAIDFPTIYNNKYAFSFYKRFYEKSIENVDKVVFLSKKAMIAHTWIADQKKTFIYNGIEDKKIIIGRQLAQTINFACVGTLLERKGQSILIEAFSCLDKHVLDKVRLFIIGDGEEYLNLKKSILNKNLENTVKLLGSRSDVPEILQKMDVFILASKTEGMPISILEAMRQGLYIMVTDVGGCSEMISPDMGEFISCSSDEIAFQIQKFLNSVSKLNDYKINARERYLKLFTIERMINNYISCLESIG